MLPMTSIRVGCNRPRPDLLGNFSRMPAIVDVAAKWCLGRGVDYGYGDSIAWPGGVEAILPGAIGVDRGVVKYPDGRTVRDDRIESMEWPADLSGLDYIFSSHALEHIADWQGALAYWRTRLRHHGRLFLYLPHESIEGWRPETYLEHVWSPTIATLLPALAALRFRIREYLDGCDTEGSFYVVAVRV
jgi:SAM-dependent methyltransferase